MPEILQPASEFISELPPYAIVGALVVIALLAIGLGRILKSPPTRLTAFSSDSGSVLISRKALQDLIRQTCRKDAWVEAARPEIRIAGKKINTTVTLRLSSAENLKSTTERLQSRVSELLQKSLSAEQIGPIELMVTGFGKQDVDGPAVPEAVSDLSPKSIPPARKPPAQMATEPKLNASEAKRETSESKGPASKTKRDSEI